MVGGKGVKVGIGGSTIFGLGVLFILGATLISSGSSVELAVGVEIDV